ncbi:MAG TPA: aminomethyl-transferring glycine dehydrogenase subunit GcvPA [Acholeplasmatales bacterium]|nr:aminomethyl-transferring glycine dehydrogenase subunit GcvPA [Acholeplasmatales bacterium]
MFKYFPHTESDLAAMRAKIGIAADQDMFVDIPEAVRMKKDYKLPAALSEIEIRAKLSEIAAMNRPAIVFSGLGAYDHYDPSVIGALLSRQEFLTSYTPYQPEIAQGTLSYIFEYQSMVTMLTGMDVSNASMYDGPTAAAEACFMAMSMTKRNKILVSAAVNPNIAEVVLTYAHFRGLEVAFIPVAEGETSLPDLKNLLDETVAGVIVQKPNYFGIVESFDGVSEAIHQNGSVMIESCDISTLAVLKTPADDGADIACGDCQSLGMPLAFGGPYLGYLATKKPHVRRMPGRIVGQSFDRNGKRAFVLTLQAREQHIRREKANSNICSNQSLMALYATIYLSLMGPDGIKRVNELSYQNAHKLYDLLIATGKFTPVFKKPFLKEFVLHTSLDQTLIRQALADHGYFGAVSLADYDDSYRDVVNFAVTEKRTQEEIERFAAVVGGL